MWPWLIILLVAWLIWRYSRPGGDCVIRLSRGAVSIRGKMSPGRRVDIERFLLEQFPEVRRLRIDVRYPRGSEALRLDITGSLSPGDRQQIRNFLTTTL